MLRVEDAAVFAARALEMVMDDCPGYFDEALDAYAMELAAALDFYCPDEVM